MCFLGRWTSSSCNVIWFDWLTNKWKVGAWARCKLLSPCLGLFRSMTLPLVVTLPASLLDIRRMSGGRGFSHPTCSLQRQQKASWWNKVSNQKTKNCFVLSLLDWGNWWPECEKNVKQQQEAWLRLTHLKSIIPGVVITEFHRFYQRRIFFFLDSLL